MKKMKRLVAVLLAGVMALAMLTACGGGGGSSVTREPETEANVVKWIEELGAENGLTLSEDKQLTTVSAGSLPYVVKLYNAMENKDQDAYYKAAQNFSKKYFNDLNGRKAYPLDLPIQGEVTKEKLAAKVNQLISQINAGLQQYGITNPTKFGVTVTKYGDGYLVFVVVGEDA